MFNSSRIIKAHDIMQTDSREMAPDGFVPGICHIPTDNRGPDTSDSRENNAIIRITNKKTREKVEEQIRIAEKKAYERGFSEGAKEGSKEGANRGKRELSPTVEALTQLMSEVGKLREEIFEHSKKEIIDLAFSIAGKVIHEEVKTTEAVALSVLQDAMKHIEGKGDVRIRLSPVDYHHIKEIKPDFLDNYGDIMIEKDEAIGRGGTMIKTCSGIVDARLDQQLDNIRGSFLDEHGF